MTTELIIADQRIQIPPAGHPGFSKVAEIACRLPQYFPPVKHSAQLVAAILAEANDRLLKDCTPNSIARAAVNAAVMGLVPGKILGHCHFIPYGKECQLVMGYKGWLELAYDGDFLRDLHCEVVLDDEEFERWNDEAGPHIRHPLPLEHEDNLVWPNVKAAYCIWHSRGGGHGMEIVGRRELEKLKRRGNVWDTNTIAMCLKTPILRASKTWRRTRRIAYAGRLEDAIDANEPQPALVELPMDNEPKPSLDVFSAPVEEKPTDNPAVEDEATECARFIDELQFIESPQQLEDIKRRGNPGWTEKRYKSYLDKIEMRLAELRGGSKSGKLFDNGQ